MNRGFGFILAVPILFLAFCITMQVKTIQTEERELEEYILSFAIDYSTDAAAAEMLNMSHLGQDYMNINKVNTDPEIALSTFINMMCMNYDLPLTDKAKLQIESGYMPVFCVAAYDGYYMYTPVQDTDGGWRLQGSLKKPYTAEVGAKYYALNLGGENTLLFDGGSITKETLESQGIAATEVYRKVNSIISDALMYEFQSETGRGNKFLYLPSNMTTISKVNPIKGPSVLAFIDGWDFKTTHAVSAFSIGGARIENARMVAAYVAQDANGVETKYYSYADLLPEDVPIADMFTSVEEAAKAGYYYDSKYMG